MSYSPDVLIDIDIPFAMFTNSFRICELKDRIAEIEESCDVAFVKKLIRKSPRGNTHVKLVADRYFTFAESLGIRAYLGDDRDRLSLDLVRFLFSNDPKRTNRLWDLKFKYNTLYQAENWEEIR